MDIFEYLRELVGCLYISDLQFGNYRSKAIEILKNIDLSNVNSKQIADAESYFGIALA